MPHSEVFYAERSDFIPNVYTMSLGTMTTCWPSLKFFRFTVTSQGKNVFISFFRIHAFYQASRFRSFEKAQMHPCQYSFQIYAENHFFRYHFLIIIF